MRYAARLIAIRLILFSAFTVSKSDAQTTAGVGVGFPVKWDGDKLRNVECDSRGIPTFLDGYFLCQLAASYGSERNPPGQKITSMLDAIGALGVFQISGGKVYFSGYYYPDKNYKIWNFHGRDFRKSSVPFIGIFTDYNSTAMALWDQVPADPDALPYPPNLDFWKIGGKVAAVTGNSFWMGVNLDLPYLRNVKALELVEDNELFGKSWNGRIRPMAAMPAQGRTDADGTIWSTSPGMDESASKFVQIVFSINSRGVRKVEGIWEFARFDQSACDANDDYTGDKTSLVSHIQSITSTERYLIVPLSSVVINPCKLTKMPPTNPNSDIQQIHMWGLDFYQDLPLRILIFDKRAKRFVSVQRSLIAYPAMFVSHQFNAYERNDGKLVADMIVYGEDFGYQDYLGNEYLKRQLFPPISRLLRFEIDMAAGAVKYDYLLPKDAIAAEFSQFNHEYEGKPYRWGYIVENPFAAGNSILKIDMDNNYGQNNIRYKAQNTVVLSEPWFVASPNSRSEDEGAILLKGLDVARKTGLLIILNAKTMTETGRATVPYVVPFGFHNRFFSKRELGLPDGLSLDDPLLDSDMVNGILQTAERIVPNNGPNTLENILTTTQQLLCKTFPSLFAQAPDFCP